MSRHPRFSSRPQVLAHRMIALGYPENTLVSLEAVGQLGCDWIECDVWNTRDGVFVSMHDSNVDRTTDGTGEVPTLTLAEIKKLNAGKGYNHGFVPVPTVEEIFRVVAGFDRVVNIELHLHNLEEPGHLTGLIRCCEVLDRAYMNMNTIATGMYIREDLGEDDVLLSLNTQEESDQMLELCQQYDVRYLCIPSGNLTAGWIQRIHEAGLFVHCYPVNTEEEMRQMVDLGVDVIQTDYVEVLQDLLRRMDYSL